MTDRPGLRDIYDRLAEQVGPQLSDLTASDGFADVVEVVDAVRIRAATELQRSSRRFLHAWNLPAGSDVTVLRQEIGALERTVRSLTRQVETLQRQLDETTAERTDPASTKRAKTKSTSETTKRAKTKPTSKTAKQRAKTNGA